LGVQKYKHCIKLPKKSGKKTTNIQIGLKSQY